MTKSHKHVRPTVRHSIGRAARRADQWTLWAFNAPKNLSSR
jgi:hypothetical protein